MQVQGGKESHGSNVAELGLHLSAQYLFLYQMEDSNLLTCPDHFLREMQQ